MIKQIFNDKEIRFIEKEDEYWAVAGDVAKVLGYSHTPHMTRLLDESEKAVHNVDTVKGKQNAVIISEIGIYEAIWNSRRDEAQEFKKWVKQVIKELRQDTGLEQNEVFRMLDKEKQKEATPIIQGSTNQMNQLITLKQTQSQTKLLQRLLNMKR